MGVTVSKSLLAVAALAGGPLLLRHYLLNSAESSQGPGKNATRNKKRREKQKQRLQAAESQSQVVTAAPQRPAPRAKDERKAEQANEVPPSSQDEDADFPPLPSTSSVSLSSKGGPKRPLAERRAPKTRQGRVADMLDPDVDSPGSVARVMQINSQGQAVPQKEAPNGTSKATRLEAKKETSWVDVQVAAASTDDSLGFEDSEETPEAEEDAWEQVPSKSQPSSESMALLSQTLDAHSPTPPLSFRGQDAQHIQFGWQ